MTTKMVHTPLGSLRLSEANGGVSGLEWHTDSCDSKSLILTNATKQIESFFNQELKEFSVPTRFVEGTPFQQKVWQAIAEIPFGKTITYGELAKRVGSSPRAVGSACGKNPIPIIIPCHRVVASNGEMTGYSAGDGVLTKKVLLDFEQQPLAYSPQLAWWKTLHDNIPKKPFYFMRHGETDYNKQGILQGAFVDSSINDVGREQARKAGEQLRNIINPKEVWCSGLKRTHQTASALLEQLPEQKRLIKHHSGLNECSFGLHDGKKFSDIPAKQHLWHSSPEGENWPVLVNRVATALEDILNQSDSEPLLVAHGIVSRCIGELVGIWPNNKIMKNCEIWYVYPGKNEQQPWLAKQIC